MKKNSQTAGRSRRSQSNRRRKTQRKVRGGSPLPTPRPLARQGAVKHRTPLMSGQRTLKRSNAMVNRRTRGTTWAEPKGVGSSRNGSPLVVQDYIN